MTDTILNLKNIRKEYGDIVAVKDISIDLYDGEFFTLLGPSGSGKSTLLQIISGLEQPTEGSVLLSGNDITELGANQQDTALIFQDFTLFPHKTVGENVAFPLKMDGVSKQERKQRGEEMLEFVNLDGYYERYPQQLSGGEQQRVALARGVISEPELLLLDEPLSSLDRKLRQELEVELRKFQRETEITFLYVTHNQEEALVMSDRIAVMNSGKIEQIGPPNDVYKNPQSSFVGRFLGESNKFVGKVIESDGDTITVENNSYEYNVETSNMLSPGDTAEVLVKVEDCEISIDSGDQKQNSVIGELRDKIFVGTEKIYRIKPEGEHEREIMIRKPKTESVSAEVGETITVTWEPTDAHAFRL